MRRIFEECILPPFKKIWVGICMGLTFIGCSLAAILALLALVVLLEYSLYTGISFVFVFIIGLVFATDIDWTYYEKCPSK